MKIRSRQMGSRRCLTGFGFVTAAATAATAATAVMVGASLAQMAVAPIAAHAQTQETATPAGDLIITAGEGVVMATPDRAYVSISAESRSKLPKPAQQMNATAMTAVQDKLKAAGIPADAVRTTTIDLQPEFDYQDGKQTLRGYVARNTIDVRIDDIAKVGDIVDLAVGSGATSVSSIRFDLKNREAAEKKALEQAVTAARGRADALAQSASRSIDRIVRIEDQYDSNPPPRPMAAAFRMAAAQDSTPVAAGQMEIRARVSLTVRLK
jgi:uncharacterized protein YggE